MIRMIAKLSKVINSGADPGQVSLAFCFSMIMGFTPLYSLHNIILLLLVLLIRVNLSAFILEWSFFSAPAYLIDPLFHRIGLFLLTASSLEGLVAVGMPVTQHPPHRSRRALLTHRAPTSGV